MYEDAFDDGWNELDREEAMFRAYALGVDAALGQDHPEVLERLVRETSRPLVQLAFDEGKSVGETALGSGDEGAASGEWSREEKRQVWADLIEARRGDPKSLELVRVPKRRTDLPSALSRPGFLDATSRDVDAIRLPRFLLE